MKFYTKKIVLYFLLILSGFSVAKAEDSLAANNKLKFYNLSNVYRLQQVKAVNYSGKVADEDMKAYQIEAEGEFQSKDYSFDPNSNTLYILGKRNPGFFKTLILEKNQNTLSFNRCETCDPIIFNIIMLTQTDVVLDVPSPDGKDFFFQYIFIK